MVAFSGSSSDAEHSSDADPTAAVDPAGAPHAADPLSDQSVEAALAASTRAEATLASLYRAIQQVTQGVSGAREANDQLGAELHRVREMLAVSNEQRLVLRNQVSLLERQLEEARSDREFLISEQDRFLAGLLEEHEQTIERLAAERADAAERLERALRQAQETARPAGAPVDSRRTHPGLGDPTPPPPALVPVLVDSERNIEKLLNERERSREVVRRLQQQRDEAQQALARVTAEKDRYLSELARIAPGRVAPPRPGFPNQDHRRTEPAVPVVANRITDPSPPDDAEGLGQGIGDRMTAPPNEELEKAIALSRATPAPVGAKEPDVDGKPPPLKRKPNPTTQPLGSYSLRAGDPQEET